MTERSRKARRRRPLWPLLLAALLFLDYGLAKLLVVDRYRLLTSGVGGSATITSRTMGYRPRDKAMTEPVPSVTYSFDVRGREYRSSQRVSMQTYRRLPIGAEVDIIYLPRDPHVSALAGSVTPVSVALPAAVLLGLNIIATGAWLSMLRSRRSYIKETKRCCRASNP